MHAFMREATVDEKVFAMNRQVEDMVVVMDEALRPQATSLAQKLRKAGRSVDLVLESKRMKWVFKVCRGVGRLQPFRSLY